jgi:hypothetical protein
MEAGSPPLGGSHAADAWPRTRRPMPWMIAGFLAMIFLVPFEAIHLNVKLPVSSDLDRFYIVLMIATWAVSGLIGRSGSVLRLRPRGWAAGMIAFVFVAVASIAFNVGRITNLGEWDVAQKKLAVLAALVAVFAIVTLTLRVAELRPFAVLIVILAVITSVGTITEQKTGYNVFYSTARAVFSPVATVDPSPAETGEQEGTSGRPTVSGPTRHPLSVASILGMTLPFAVVLAAVASDPRRRLLWGLAACVIAAGALVTQRKAGVVIPAFALLALFAARPRQFLRLAPYGIAAVVIGLALSGGSFSSVSSLESVGSQDSTGGRTSDYPAIVPDLLSNPLLGRGYGTHNTIRVDTYRIFDNEFLGEVYQVGVLGLLAFLGLVLTPLFVVRAVLRSDNPLRGPPALAAGASCVAFGVACALYDILSFSEAPYLFLFMAAVCTCAACVELPVDGLRRSSPKAVALPAHA